MNRAQRSAARSNPAALARAARCALGSAGARGQGPGACIILLAAGLAQGAIFPDTIGEFAKGSSKALAAPDAALYQEFGYQAGEQAEYLGAGKRLTASAWRLRDSTGALALFEVRRPASATPAKLSALSALTQDGAIVAYGNYVFEFTSAVPEQAALDQLFAQLPQLEQSPLPALAGFLPKKGLIPNSERYVLGPVSLAGVESRITPSMAAFHLGSEAQVGRYRTPKGELTLAIFNYPTPSMARERQEEFGRLPGTLAKRSGPLVAVIVQPPDRDAAERILAQVRYEANLTWNERVPVDEAKPFANMILSIFTLAGFLIGLSVLVGIGFGGFRVVLRKLGRPMGDEAMIVLRIGDK